MLAQAHGYAGQKDQVPPLLAEAEQAKMYMCPYETAVAYLSLGDDASYAARFCALLPQVAMPATILYRSKRGRARSPEPEFLYFTVARWNHAPTPVMLRCVSIRSWIEDVF
jgi:hypothetical protein